SEQQIMHKISQQPKRAATLKQLVREFGLRGAARNQLATQLRSLVASGSLIHAPDDRFAIPQKAKSAAQGLGKNQASGRLSMHRDGFGFVIPDDPALAERMEGDIFIPPPAIGAAMHGDRVIVDLVPGRDSGRMEGRIVKIAGRAHSTVVGTFHYGSKYNYVRPIDEKISQDVIIPAGAEKPRAKPPAEDEESRHRVIGREAKRTQFADLENVVVDVEITDWPSPTQNPRGRVVEVLGYEDDFGVDVEIIIRKHHIPHAFPARVLEEAETFSHIINQSEMARRKDWRSQPIVTIDGETARDFDDAVRAINLPNGNFQLQVHIADVAHYVTEDSAIDREARMRGTSVYFPDRAVPMLPMELSTDICSLRPQVERLVMSCVMEIDHQGEIVGYEISQGVIRSAERMTYTGVQGVLDGDKALRQRYSALVPEFERMQELAQILNRKRKRRGSIDFDLPEPIIEFDELGAMQGVTKSERLFAHRLIEEFMLAANECVAEYLEHRGVASLYRIHEPPDAKRVYDFETIAATFGYSLGVGALPIQRVTMRSEKRQRHGSGRNPQQIEIPKEVHITPRMYQKLTAKIAGTPEERILSFLMLRSLKQARYSERNEGHFALAAPTYTHFTSPIRRYPDLIVHRILKGVLADGESGHSKQGQKHSGDGASPWDGPKPSRKKKSHDEDERPRVEIIPLTELHPIADTSSDTERRADEAERELMEWKKLTFMRDRVGEEFAALIVSVTKFGFFVELEDLFIEGLVPLASLTDDRYTYRENTRQIIGERTRKTYAIGQRLRVLLDRIDRLQRKLQFAVVEPEPSRAQKRHKTRR
ncbi:MAG: ribonuclease R family protein, partial [Terriglobales bacterium]